MCSAFRLLNYIKILSPHEKESGNFSVRGIWNPEKKLLVKSGILGFEIQNTIQENLESC